MKSTRAVSEGVHAGRRTPGVAAYSSYLLRQAAGALRGVMDRALEPTGVTQPQFAVLAVLSLHPGASGAELARLTQLTPQTLTVITRNLATAGLIRRTPAAAGRRQIPYEVSKAGQTVLARGKQIVAEVEAQIVHGFSAAELFTVKRWLVEVATRLHGPAK